LVDIKTRLQNVPKLDRWTAQQSNDNGKESNLDTKGDQEMGGKLQPVEIAQKKLANFHT
jgi:hypothetical protein